VSGRCDRCAGELYRRDDDAPGVVQERLRVYRTSTEPVVAFYRDRSVLERLDGSRTRDEVYAELKGLVMRAA
jgi:adenylate kinase